jgi:hypothetical protein
MTNTEVKETKAVSKRETLGADGKDSGWTDAVAIRYTATRENFVAVIQWADCDEDLEATADKFLDLRADSKQNEAALFGLASFGGLTYLGNITNPVRNPTDKAKPLAHDDGTPVTEADRLVLALDNLANGEWTNQRGEGEGSTALIVEALARIKGYAIEEARAKWKERTDDERKALSALKLVKRTILEIRMERMDAKGETATSVGF